MFFYVPNYLEQDFDDLLLTIGQLCTLNERSISPSTLYVNINTLDFKSNMKGLSDSTFAIECSLSSIIKKGDYLKDSEGKTYLINWHPSKSINCLNSQIQLCTISLDFVRFQGITYDSMGNSSTPCSYLSIATEVDGYLNRVGMGTYDSGVGQIGIPPTQKVCIGIQYNVETLDIKIGDEFTYAYKQHIVTDIDYSQINPTGSDGILVIYAQVLEGGNRD